MEMDLYHQFHTAITLVNLTFFTEIRVYKFETIIPNVRIILFKSNQNLRLYIIFYVLRLLIIFKIPKNSTEHLFQNT